MQKVAITVSVAVLLLFLLSAHIWLWGSLVDPAKCFFYPDAWGCNR